MNNKIQLPILSIFADGLRSDSLKFMPFLSKFNSVPLKTILGYSITCHPSMYTGYYPDKHKIVFHWIRALNKGPYRAISYLPHIFPFTNSVFQSIISHYYSKIFLRSNSFMGYSKILNLPIKFWKYLDINETKYWDEDNYVNQEIKTIFELVRQNDIKHHISRLYKPNLGKINSLEIVDPKDYDWIYYFIGESDHISHEFAQHSEEGKALLLKLDNFIKDRYKEFENTYKNFVFIFWSDHGHIPIVKRYNLYKVFKDEKKNLNKFFHIVDSTTVRFWINRFEDFEYIMSVMKGIPEAHLVYDNDFASLNLPKERNIYGDLFYYLDGGVTFTHTIHGHGLKVKSMHGYHPNAEGNDGLFVSNKNIDGRSASLPDIFCTISQILNLNYYPSIRLDGKNIISE